MFTGLVEGIGALSAVSEPTATDSTTGAVRRLTIETPFVGDDETPALGDSVAVDGVCLTVTARDPARGTLSFDVGHESRKRTTLGTLRQGQRVHLERALRFGARLGGHLVTGHVDGVGEVVRTQHEGGSFIVEVRPPKEVMALSMAQGAIALSGVSLTLNAVGQETVTVGLVPHTLEKTTLGAVKAGTPLNCEADMMARYVAKLLTRARPAVP